MISTQVITNTGETPLSVDRVEIPRSTGMEVDRWFLVGMDEYPTAAMSSPGIPPPPAGSAPTLEPGQTKRVAVVLKVTADHTTEGHLTIDYREESGREGSLTPARQLLAVPHGKECP